MKTKLRFFVLLPIVALAAVFAQGPLTPPGAPAPAMKTLDQIEPRIEVNATNTPGTIGSLFLINAPGSYYLTGNITGVSGKNGIAIAASGVTLDLNGFEIRGVPGSFVGITSVSRRDLSIRNGLIRDWGGNGLEASGCPFSTFENLRCGNNGGFGLKVTGASAVRDCVASENTSGGIQCNFLIGSTNAGATLIENSVANGNGGHGLHLGSAAAIHHCVSEYNSGDGIFSDDALYTVTVTNGTVLSNTGNGISVAGRSTLTNCTARDNAGSYGIRVGDGSTLTHCTASDNAGTHGIFAGVGSTLTGCTAHSNDVEFGINAGDRSTLTNCTASLNTSAAADSWGISAGAQCTISNCSVNGNLNTNGTPGGNTGGGILAGTSSTVQNCTVAGNKGDGIQMGGDSRVVGNNCDSNGFGGGNAAGIHSTGADNRIEGNNVTENTRGIDIDSSGSLIIKNSASGNTSNYEIAANNVFGAIVDRIAPASAAVSGNSAASSAGTADPWANFSY